MIRWSRILLVLVAVGFVIGILLFTAPLDQAARIQLLFLGCIVLILLLGCLILWYRRER
jgi:hypothetical protein